MERGAFNSVPGGGARRHEGVEVFSLATIQHPVTKSMWSPEPDSDGCQWFGIMSRHPDEPSLETSPEHAEDYGTIQYEAGSHFNVIELVGPTRNEAE